MKHKMQRKWILCILLLISTLLVSGCAEATEFFSYQPDEEEKIEVVDKGLLSIDRIKTLNPIVSKDKDVYFVNKLVYRSLFTLDSNLHAQKDIVESYSFDLQKNTLDLTIKRGLKWSDGKALTAEDVKFSIDAYKQASYSGQTLYSGLVLNIQSVSSDGDKVVIRYIKPTDICLEDLTFPIIAQHSFKNLKATLNSAYNYIPLTSGQYSIEKYNPFSELVLSGNEHYDGEIPGNELVFKIIPKESENTNLIEPNLITIAFSEKITRDVDFANLDAQTDSFVSNEVEWVGFNMSKPNLANKNVRTAIAMSMNLEKILESAYFGNGVLTDSIYFPGYWGVENQGAIHKNDLNEAQKILDEVGFKDVDGDGQLEDPAGNPFQIDILINSKDESRSIAAAQIQKSLQELNIATQINSLDWENYLAAISFGQYDLYIGGGRMGENYDLRPLLASTVNNPVRYQNPALDTYLNQLQSALTAEEKLKIYKKVKALLAEEIPYYPLVYKTYGIIRSNDFNGEVDPAFYDLYRCAETWTYNHVIESETEDEATEELL